MSYLLITFANSLDPHQAQQNVGPDLDPNSLTLRWYFCRNFSKRKSLKKINRQWKNVQNFPVGKELKFKSDACPFFIISIIITECRLMITFANSLEPDQARQKVKRDVDLNYWHSDGSTERIFWKKKSADNKKVGKNSQGGKELEYPY